MPVCDFTCWGRGNAVRLFLGVPEPFVNLVLRQTQFHSQLGNNFPLRSLAAVLLVYFL